MKSTLRFSLFTFLAVASANAAVVNLVTNGSFEQGTLGFGSFQGWTTSLGDNTTFVDSSGQQGSHFNQASDGLWAAYFGSTFADGGATISQTLATTAQTTYVLTFDLANDNGGLTPANGFTVSLGGTPVFTFSNLANQDYVHEQFVFKAAGSATGLTFSGFNDQSYLELDNVAVVAAPEPSAAALLAAGCVALFLAQRARSLSARRNG